ncbi:PLDc N-terminal domain-containing protein [Flavobacterium sp. GT3R68]|uniref:PLDc N-terminal domain-containing protein n=1 Tax=Flavobacterium sp. GT3R68 TaxID=2594437 RepID=UPI000F895F0B|nr:PLDc N-terminal domain-containing protein [Flavobacterium sp. GT3R68]RTY95302.1 hypothetical protein EKL32_07680 [Flavobacterium sp. GSN2]TRW90957.1 hypothetical protein FNW07_08990 [Flavobacterium sp. GT3R68]
MKINKKTILIGCYILSLILILTGVIFKINHWDAPYLSLLEVGLLSSLLFMVLAIAEIVTSKRIDTGEKILWVMGFLVMSTVAGLIYLLSGRKTVVEQKPKEIS